MHGFGRCFRHLLWTTCTLKCTKHFSVPSVDGATRNFAKRKQSDADFAPNNIRMVTIEIVINSALGRLTLLPVCIVPGVGTML